MSPVVRKQVEVRVVGARGLKNVAWIGVNQPVAVAWVSPKAARSTQVAVNGGANPVWNERLLVPVNEDLQRSVSWVLKVQVSHHVGFLCCLHRPIGTATIPVADILNAGNHSYNGHNGGGGSSSNSDRGICSGGMNVVNDISASSPPPHITDLQTLPLLSYPLLGAFNRQHGFLDLRVRLLKVLPHSHSPFHPPSPSPSPPHSAPKSSSGPPPLMITPSSPSSTEHETPSTSPAHSLSSSSSSKHSFHEADLPLSSPPSSPLYTSSAPTLSKPSTLEALPASKSSGPPSSHSTLKSPSTTISPLPPPSRLTPAPPTTTPSFPIKPFASPPSPAMKASLPITAPIPATSDLTSGLFPAKSVPRPPPPAPSQNASRPIPIPPPHTSPQPPTIGLPTPQKPTSAIETTSPTSTYNTSSLSSPISASSLRSPHLTQPPTNGDPLLLATTTCPPPPPSKRTVTLIHISTTSTSVPNPRLPAMDSLLSVPIAHKEDPSPLAKFGSGDHATSSKSKTQGMHQKASSADIDHSSKVGAAAAINGEIQRDDEEGRAWAPLDCSDLHAFLPYYNSPSPYDYDDFFDLEHLYPAPQLDYRFNEPLDACSAPTHCLYACQDLNIQAHHLN